MPVLYSQAYTMPPCGRLYVTIGVEDRKLTNKPDSPCNLGGYPDELLAMVKSPLTPENLYNGIFAPDLPYDYRTCKQLCTAKKWLEKCQCHPYESTHMYTGRLYEMCPETGNNHRCTMEQFQSFPPLNDSECQCYEKCQGYTYYVIGSQIPRTVVGKLHGNIQS